MPAPPMAAAVAANGRAVRRALAVVFMMVSRPVTTPVAAFEDNMRSSGDSVIAEKSTIRTE